MIGARRRAAAAWLGLALAAAGCATPPAQGWLSGRLLVKVEATAEQPSRSLSSAFELRGDADAGELRLTSSFGTTVAEARWSPGTARLVTSDGERHFTDLEALAREALGEALPLRALPAWLRGRPWAGADSRATPAGFEQLGWQVDLMRFAEGWLEATRPAPQAVIVRARLDPP